jgi:O-antigen biosynthesis protein
LDAGTPSCGCGDLDMIHRVVAAGVVLRYEPAAWMRHRDRRDMDSLALQIYQNGRSFGVYLIKIWRTRSISRLELAHFAWYWTTRWLMARLVRRLLRRSAFPLRLIWAEIWGAMHSPWAYVATYRSDRRLRAGSWE